MNLNYKTKREMKVRPATWKPLSTEDKLEIVKMNMWNVGFDFEELTEAQALEMFESIKSLISNTLAK